MRNAIYTGFIIHNRTAPKPHKFQYKLRMFFLDIDNLTNTFKNIPFVSINKINLISFYRKNYFPSKTNLSLREEIEEEIKRRGYDSMPKKIYILTHLSYLGFCYNPVSFYYCYDAQDNLIYFLSEVNNTPWNERHIYFQQIVNNGINAWVHDKEFHVSPFLPINLQYSWKINEPNEQVRISLACIANATVFRATLKLVRSKIDFANCLSIFVVSPLTTLLIVLKIYWQALWLYIKKIPFYQHPNRI